MAHHRFLPAIDAGTGRVRRARRVGLRVVRGRRDVAADVEEVTLFGSPTEELAELPVREVIGGYYRQVGVVWDGGRTLWRG